MVCFLRPTDQLVFSWVLPAVHDPILGAFVSWPSGWWGELDPLEVCDAACRVKIPARRVLGPQLENWEPGTNDHLVLLGRKDVCVAKRKVVSTREIKRGKADIITLIKTMPCASALALKDAIWISIKPKWTERKGKYYLLCPPAYGFQTFPLS